MSKITSRVYQRNAVKVATTALKSVLRALVVLATGLGKTLTSAFIAKEFKAKRILFLVHNNFILEHALREFQLVFDKKTTMAVYNGMSKNGSAEADIVFATWQTMGKSLKQWKRKHFDLVIVDEAHHAEAETYKPVLKYFMAPRLGITATPDRGDGADIRDVFGDEVVNISLEEAIARGWLPRIEYHVITDESLDEDVLQEIVAEIKQGKKRFTMAEVNRRIFIKKRDTEIAKIINKYDEKSVVFCASISHAERVAKALRNSGTFHSQKGSGQKETQEKNQATLDALGSGEVKRVCAVNAFNEGVNVPSVGLVAFCRITDSETIFRQQLGRGLRPGKDKLIVLDFVGNLERIQLVLNTMSRISDLHEKYTSKEKRKSERCVREKFEVSGAGFKFTFSDEIVDLMEVLNHCNREFYATWQEASDAARNLGITTFRDYHSRYAEDARLPSQPREIYPDFPGWFVFLGKERPVRCSTWQEASVVACNLGISTRKEYFARRRECPELPSSPEQYYEDFPGWVEFLEKIVFYSTWQEASVAVVSLGIKTLREYSQRHKDDPRLPASLKSKYGDYPGWKVFLGNDNRFYPTWQEASSVAISLGIKSQSEYFRRYKEDPLLVPLPHRRYKNFPGYEKFLGKK